MPLENTLGVVVVVKEDEDIRGDVDNVRLVKSGQIQNWNPIVDTPSENAFQFLFKNSQLT